MNYFLRTLSNEFKPIIEVEKANIASQVGRSDADIWDINFARAAPYTHRPSISRYLNFYDVMDGISKITSILYGVKLERETPKVNEVWHPDVVKYMVIHDVEGDYGTLYIDPFRRQEKNTGDAQFTVQCGKQLEDEYQNPIIVVAFNINPNSNEQLTHHELVTVFHEMGHAMHSFLGRTRFQVNISYVVVADICFSIYLELVAQLISPKCLQLFLNISHTIETYSSYLPRI